MKSVKELNCIPVTILERIVKSITWYYACIMTYQFVYVDPKGKLGMNWFSPSLYTCKQWRQMTARFQYGVTVKGNSKSEKFLNQFLDPKWDHTDRHNLEHIKLYYTELISKITWKLWKGSSNSLSFYKSLLHMVVGWIAIVSSKTVVQYCYISARRLGIFRHLFILRILLNCVSDFSICEQFLS